MTVDATIFAVELLDRRGWIDVTPAGKCVKHSMADCWCVVSLTVSPKMYSEVRNGALKYTRRLAADQTDTH